MGAAVFMSHSLGTGGKSAVLASNRSHPDGTSELFCHASLSLLFGSSFSWLLHPWVRYL